MALARLRSPRELSTLAVRLLGAVGYIIAGLVTVNPPNTDKGHSLDLAWIVGLGLVLAGATTLEWLTHKDDDVTKSVREGMVEHQRYAMYARVQLVKEKVYVFEADADRRIVGAAPDNPTDRQIVQYAAEQDRIAVDEFTRHLWIETRNTIRECARLPYVSVDSEWSALADGAPSSRGDISQLFIILDHLSAQLLHPLEIEKRP